MPDEKVTETLFDDITNGLTSQGWEDIGGNSDSFLIMRKGKKTLKVYSNLEKEPYDNFMVRLTNDLNA